MASSILMKAQIPCSQHTQPSPVLRSVRCLPSPSILLFWHRCLPQAHRKHRLKLAAAKTEPFFLMRLGSSGKRASPPPPNCPELGLACRAAPGMTEASLQAESFCSRPAAPVAVFLEEGLFLSLVSSLKPHHPQTPYSSKASAGLGWRVPCTPPFCAVFSVPLNTMPLDTQGWHILFLEWSGIKL